MKTSLLVAIVKSNQLVENIYRQYRKWKKRKPFLNLSNEEIFTQIYKTKVWGASNTTAKTRFYSGDGSYGEHAESYVSLINSFIKKNNITSITDIGCGDFALGHKIASSNPFLLYNGCDVVRELIENNQQQFGSEKIKFHHLDATTDVLPHAELLTIREVLQHLSNSNIEKILNKIHKYKYVIITERLYKDEFVKSCNKDKPTGPDIRLIDNSGVYINKPPFNLSCTEILKCRVDAFGKEAYLKSFLIIN